MGRVLAKITRRVPGSLTFENTRHTETTLFWGADEDERRLLFGWYLADDRDSAPTKVRGEEFLVELPGLPRSLPSLDALSDALGERFARHPLSNQLPGATTLAEAALAAGFAPLDVAGIAARYLCPGGVARALGHALASTSGHPFRGTDDLASIRAVAHACQVMRLGTLQCLGRDGRSVHEDCFAKWLGELPVYPADAWRHGGTIVEGCIEHDRQQSGYLRAVAACVERALALPPERLDPAWEVILPSGALTPDEARSRVNELFAGTGRSLWFFGSSLRDALRELHGQPFDEVRAPLIAMLLGRCPVPRPEGADDVTHLLSESPFVFAALDVILATDRDLTGLLREQAEAKAKQEAAWVARNAASVEPVQAPVQAPAPSPWSAALRSVRRFFGW